MARIEVCYAKALFESVKNRELVLNQLREIEKSISKDSDIKDFFGSHTVSTESREKVLRTVFESRGLEKEIISFLVLLNTRNRMGHFTDIVKAFEELSDAQFGVTRGEVVSASPLAKEAQTRIEQVVAEVTKKKVILSYQINSNLVGGLVAKVGGWTFEDAISSHMNKLNEDLKRRDN